MPGSPSGYVVLPGSERHVAPGAARIARADDSEELAVTIHVRRRTDRLRMLQFEYWSSIPPKQREHFTAEEFEANYGASATDLDQVVSFAESAGLNVREASSARRSLVVSGSVAAMNRAFRVSLAHYESSEMRYRGREGTVSIPIELSDIVEGVFGLDNRKIGGNSTADPPNTAGLTPPQVANFYSFPAGTADGQTIGIIEVFGGYRLSDIQLFYQSLGSNFRVPVLTDVYVDGAVNLPGEAADAEIVLDITVASSVAQGANIVVYFSNPTQQGWVDVLNRAIHPGPGDPIPSVLSISDYICNGDDSETLANWGVTPAFVNAVSSKFQDAAARGVTVLVATGDAGSDSSVGDGKAHVQYPGSDPWVTSCGGTTIGNIRGSNFDEYVWNDGQGASGGGVSDFFTSLPAYQNDVGVPRSVNDAHVGRGVPDVAGNASNNSGYAIYVGGSQRGPGAGTSAVAPLYAGLIALINARRGKPIGFLNPILYQLGGDVFRDISSPPGPSDNALNGAPGYQARAGWDACTGWGSIRGTSLLSRLSL
jgi:kumamolisin